MSAPDLRPGSWFSIRVQSDLPYPAEVRVHVERSGEFRRAIANGLDYAGPNEGLRPTPRTGDKRRNTDGRNQENITGTWHGTGLLRARLQAGA
jgi:hypothetical protein